jgi:hypothetical protein
MPTSRSHGRTYVFYIHRLSQDVVNYVKLSMWVILDWSTYNLSSSLPDWIASVYTIHMSVTFPLIFHFRTFLEKYLSQNFLFFRVCIVVLHIVIVWLIKYACSVMIAIRIFVPVSPHLVDNLSLSWLRT